VTAGPKVAHFDRVEWRIISDASTAANALRSGEVDWFEQPPSELIDMFRRDRNVKVGKLDRFPQVAGLRFNQLSTPFNNKQLRQALLPAINQEDFMLAVSGEDRSLWQTGVGFFTPGGSSASSVGTEVFTGPRSIDRAKQLMREAGYNGQPMRQLGATDHPTVSAVSLVAEDLFRRLGFNNDIAMSDWGTVTQRRASREPIDKGGWSVFQTTFGWFELLDPAVNITLRGNGTGAYFGWPTMPQMETLRDSWFDAPDDAARKAIAEDMQRLAFDELPFMPLGAFSIVTALRSNLQDRVETLPVFWNIKRG
jgi:peptide/nickel transport system substrate-binding protein